MVSTTNEDRYWVRVNIAVAFASPLQVQVTGSKYYVRLVLNEILARWISIVEIALPRSLRAGLHVLAAAHDIDEVDEAADPCAGVRLRTGRLLRAHEGLPFLMPAADPQRR